MAADDYEFVAVTPGELVFTPKPGFVVWRDLSSSNGDKVANLEIFSPFICLDTREGNLVRVLTAYGVGFIHITAFD